MIQNSYEHIAFKVSQNDIEVLFDKLFEQYLPKIKKLIKDRWLLGKKPNGDLIGFYASDTYERYKYFEISDKAGYGKIDLTLTGSLGDKIDISIIDAGEYEIFSRDNKYDEIVENFGEYNFNITDKERDNIVAEITKKVVNEIIKIAYYE